jgi:iduronate 2-sulfatase
MKKLIALLWFFALVAHADRPNVLFIAVDDLRTELGCYGVKRVHSPNIDSLAAQGMRFDNAYVQAAFCNPSRVSFLTGLRPDKTGVLDNTTCFRETLPEIVTLPQLFRQKGYYTYNIGKIFHGTRNMCDVDRSWSRYEFPEPTKTGLSGKGRNLTGGALKWCRWLAAEGGDEDQPDGQTAKLAVEFLEAGHKEPFFLAVGFHKPHDPFHAPAKYFDLYPEEEVRLYEDPVNMSPSPEHSKSSGFAKAFDKFTEREKREFLRAYYACISFMDAQLGKVLKALRSGPNNDNTIIVLVSDHGYHLGQRNWWNKNTLYEHTGRAPMLVFSPSMKAKGGACSRIVEFVDIYPTVIELCGIEAPHALDGRSFAPLLDNPEMKWKDAAYMQLVRGKVDGRAVRNARYRYIEFDRGEKGRELFDHKNDDNEFYNLAGNPEFAEVTEQMRALLHRGPVEDR